MSILKGRKNAAAAMMAAAMAVLAVPAPGASEDAALSLRGYLKVMPGVQADEDFKEPKSSGLLHNRLNFRWDISEQSDLRVEGRNRLIYNDRFRDLPGIKDIFGRDNGLVDMSRVWFTGEGWVGHSMVDRLYLSWNNGDWRIRTGRQRVNWGINLVSNPNDLFNVYSFFDFDYEERPGADALRVQRYLDHLSSIELAAAPAGRGADSVAAVKYSQNYNGYDVQKIAGYFRDRLALGAGWAGSLGEAGFKGETTWFYDLTKTEGVDRGNFVAAAGLDYMFSNGTFGLIEVLYNGGHGRDPGEIFLITEPLRPDNIMFSEFAVTLSADRMFSPVLSGGFAVMGLPDINAFFARPSLVYSVARDLDLEFISQVFFGGEGTVLENAGTSFFVSLTFSF